MVTKQTKKTQSLMVKVEFRTASKHVVGECLWIELLGVDVDGFVTGYLRNEPVMILGRWGQLVRFQTNQVVEIRMTGQRREYRR